MATVNNNKNRRYEDNKIKEFQFNLIQFNLIYYNFTAVLSVYHPIAGTTITLHGFRLESVICDNGFEVRVMWKCRFLKEWVLRWKILIDVGTQTIGESEIVAETNRNKKRKINKK